MGLYQQKHCQLGLKGQENQTNGGRLGLLRSYRTRQQGYSARHALGFKKKNDSKANFRIISLKLPPQFQRARTSPPFQQARWPTTKVLEAGMPSRALVVGLLYQWAQKVGSWPQWVCKVGHQVKEHCSQDLRLHGVCLAMFWTCQRPLTLSFFPISPFWNDNIYHMPVPQSYFVNT